jgi:hypothetical protein
MFINLVKLFLLWEEQAPKKKDSLDEDKLRG